VTANVPSASLSVMLIVSDATSAVEWYTGALGAELLWDLGGVAGLHIDGAPFFLHEAVPATDHQVPWGIHRQGGFTDPFGHRWSVGDPSPLAPFSPVVDR
jgi:PhnB protein